MQNNGWSSSSRIKEAMVRLQAKIWRTAANLWGNELLTRMGFKIFSVNEGECRDRSQARQAEAATAASEGLAWLSSSTVEQDGELDGSQHVTPTPSSPRPASSRQVPQRARSASPDPTPAQQVLFLCVFARMWP